MAPSPKKSTKTPGSYAANPVDTEIVKWAIKWGVICLIGLVVVLAITITTIVCTKGQQALNELGASVGHALININNALVKVMGYGVIYGYLGGKLIEGLTEGWGRLIKK